MSTPSLSRIGRRVLIAASVAGALSAQAASDADLPVPHHVAVASTSAQSAEVVRTARRYAAFWNTGDEAYAKLALSPAFIDRTLPDGRPQGPDGPLQASKGFRAAVPDLHAEIDDLVVAGDRASVHLHFHGHFTGQFQHLKGNGQTVDFQAFDLYRVKDGRIVENWHLEDNLTLLKQLGAIKP
ncbi:ester cyclase [Paraburkholderia sp. BL17N1]|uniref:ester cyclase n=1 Tax=Paraburkholderia sp. BL17N1 TaxID=1938798 RepID=UPI000EADA1C2|nr:ester cyclase [Paraburkholderia sp. BL17N1]RKR42590.1 putative ester cyclase [Paraburkholderia sp. BL17N1]